MPNSFPDFTKQGYRVQAELGHNLAGGRVTYLASKIASESGSLTSDRSGDSVAIKQFQFASTGADWSAYKAHEREIQVLQRLSHPDIPRYLDSFETANGFCMVQEYKDAPSLAVTRSFEPEQIKQVAVSVLEILTYLQAQSPPVIHRDIKPENILVGTNSQSTNKKLEVYLIDFGFAQFGEGELTASSMVKGTLGFMPPEQLFNRQLVLASDLYGLGATLICLATGTKSINIADLLDEDYRIQFRHLVPRLSLRWIEWLEKMVARGTEERFADAATALEALTPIYVKRTPEVKLTRSVVELKASEVGEQLRAKVGASNRVPDTTLKGIWQVAAHLGDAALPAEIGAGESKQTKHINKTHPWIALSPTQFEGNGVECEIIVDTRQLRAGKIYEREILLRGNGVPEIERVLLNVETAPIPIAIRKLPYSWLGCLFLVSLAGAIAAGATVATFVAVALSGFSTWVGLSNRLGARNNLLKITLTAAATALVAAIAGFTMGAIAGATVTGAWATAVLSVATSATGLSWLATAIKVKQNFDLKAAIAIPLLAATSGICLGIGLSLGWPASLLVLAAISGIPVLAFSVTLPILQQRRLARYRQQEKHLIEF
ncbi:MAG: serine/threonine protein kinase [Oscillatoria sp. SIO1A7]|nr:serine/threonine protein kinase [Oscillatoria sp. SIO1A7]